jgi:rhodanese-related sulfurtransferase
MGLLSDPDIVFVDVRKPKEQAVSMIPGAITDDQFLDQLELYRGQQVIAYCTISYRSGKLAAKLQKKRISITNLKEGLLGWVHAGGPLVRQNQPVHMLHVYGRKWDLAPDHIETVY